VSTSNTKTGAIQQPIQQALVALELIVVMTCVDNPYFSCDPLHFPIAVAYDPEPGDMAFLPQNFIVQEVASQLSTFNEMDVQSRMWIDHPYDDPDIIDSYSDPAERKTFFWNFMDLFVGNHDISRDFFVTILENGTNTGVLRQHAMRLNSSVQCSTVPKSSYPSTCSGRRPFQASYSQPGFVDIRVCVPGEFGVFPWTRVRSRQDIDEELFLDASVSLANVSIDTYGGGSESNFTIHCTAQTTRGYFEIGNYRNNYTYGPLVDEWPNPTEMAYEWNDYLNSYAGYRPASNDDPSLSSINSIFVDWGTRPVDPFGTTGLFMSGPLMTSAIAMFGNQSFFFIASNSSESTFPPALTQICQQGNVPFSRLGLLKFDGFQGACTDIATTRSEVQQDVGDLASLIWNWVSNFKDNTTAREALAVSMFLSNQAMLTITSSATEGLLGAREIFTAPGEVVFKPTMTLAGKIIITVLIAFQLAGIGWIIWYIHKVPTWTVALDAMAVAMMGKNMEDEDLPPIGPLYEKDMKRLGEIDGLVGVIEHTPDRSEEAVAETASLDSREKEQTTTKSSALQAHPPFRLGLGAPGIINRKLAPPKQPKKTKWRSKKHAEEVSDNV
jgi:hypothetical protein